MGGKKGRACFLQIIGCDAAKPVRFLQVSLCQSSVRWSAVNAFACKNEWVWGFFSLKVLDSAGILMGMLTVLMTCVHWMHSERLQLSGSLVQKSQMAAVNASKCVQK